MAKQTVKTNVMRVLEKEKVLYEAHEYNEEETDGEKVAALVGKPANTVFKTLVTEGGNRTYFVFVIPVENTLNLKKAAKAAGCKSLSMLKQKDLLPLTGYVHGGCSPVGMKKMFPTFFHKTAENLEKICVSAGKRGCQVELSPLELCSLVKGSFADLTD
ncbi:MAG: Cys-tRNA(Pro) deacylase [Ruminococcaceae bacterium]|nr:Cys-tRNA(Pro) deacylase [Oscillospiraceae bacterium]